MTITPCDLVASDLTPEAITLARAIHDCALVGATILLETTATKANKIGEAPRLYDVAQVDEEEIGDETVDEALAALQGAVLVLDSMGKLVRPVAEKAHLVALGAKS